jgi:hypothetical protein
VSKHTLNGKPGGTSTSYLTSDHVRMAQDGGHEIIIDLKSGVMTTLDGAKKTYYTTTKQDMEQFAAKMQEKMNDPEMKKGMEMMGKMSEGMGGSIGVKKTGESRTVAGFRCDEWVITMNTFTTMKECVTSELQYPVRAFDAYKNAREHEEDDERFRGHGQERGRAGREDEGHEGISRRHVDEDGRHGAEDHQRDRSDRGSHGIDSGFRVGDPGRLHEIENPMLKAFEGRGRGRR